MVSGMSGHDGWVIPGGSQELGGMEPRGSWLRPLGVRMLVACSVLVLLTGCAFHGTDALSPEQDPTRAVQVQSSEQLNIPSAHEILGHWQLVSVRGEEPPKNAMLGLTMTQRGHEHWATWSDGLNDHSVRWRLTQRGEFRRSDISVTAVGCVGSCTYPSGFGVVTASDVRLTATGQLVFLNGRGTETARYRRS
jgi:hypothetical protein